MLVSCSKCGGLLSVSEKTKVKVHLCGQCYGTKEPIEGRTGLIQFMASEWRTSDENDYYDGGRIWSRVTAS